MPEKEKSVLYVEGRDDMHVIRHLLSRHGVDVSEIEIKHAEGKDALLSLIEQAVSVSNGRSVGFVLDADESAPNRWRAVRDRLEKTGLDLPKEIPPDGFVGKAEKYQAQVGVWLMPDNRQSGALETLLEGLIDSGDALFVHARDSTSVAKEKGAAFADAKRTKSELHAWLAWQEEPGLPYGSAIKAHYFGHDSTPATDFVKWFKRVFLAPWGSDPVD